MKVGFDLDGTLDRPALRDLALALVAAHHEVHVISGCFLEAGDWQSHKAKFDKLVRLGLARHGVHEDSKQVRTVFAWEREFHYTLPFNLQVHILDAVDHEKYDRNYRLVDLGLRKGAYIAERGIELMFDDSELYIKTMPSMCGAQFAQVMR